MTNDDSVDITPNPGLTVASTQKEEQNMSRATEKITALYCRLSQEVSLDGDSNSIVNQRIILERFAREKHFPNPLCFVDDGYSGTNFERPASRKCWTKSKQTV